VRGRVVLRGRSRAGGDLEAHLARAAGANADEALAAAGRREAALVRAGGDRGDATGGALAPLVGAGLAAAATVGPLEREGSDALSRWVAAESGLPPDAAAFELYASASAAALVADAPPRELVRAHLRLLAALAPVMSASLWAIGPDGALALEASDDSGSVSRHARTAARRALTGAEPDTGLFRAARLGHGDEADAAVVARARSAGDREAVDAFLEEAARSLANALERARLAGGEAAAGAAIGASERRLVRLGLDLHDGALQELIALAVDLRFFRTQLAGVLGDEHRALVLGRVDDLEARLIELERELRELIHSLEPRSLVERPFAEVVQQEVDGFRARTGAAASLVLDGEFDLLTASQRLALLRVTREALANAAEHAAATTVDVSIVEREDGAHLVVRDDGQGFDFDRAAGRAAQQGRLGLSGMRARIGLLGGSFTVETRPGGPTRVVAHVPRWTPGAASTG
jgi:signal transduction histidine kinase